MFFLNPHDRFRIERGARQLRRLGARTSPEFLAEGIREGDDVGRLIDRLNRYQQGTPAMIWASGGDKFPPTFSEVPR
jgi:hypothetical protein